MAIRFRKSIKIAPGLKLNIGKKSASVRIGGRNAGLTVGTRGRTVSGSIPGTGIGVVHRNSSRKGGASFLYGLLIATGFVIIFLVVLGFLFRG